jgi:hypothetical protein
MRLWIVDCFHDAVAFSRSSYGVRELLAFASTNLLHLVSHGGGTIEAEYVNLLELGHPVITVSMMANQLPR